MMLLFTAQSFIFLDLSQFQQIRDLGFPAKCHDMYTLTVWLALFDDTCSDSVDAQLAKMERKVAAGADYFQTQAVFEPEKFIKFMEKAKQFGKPVQVGIIIPKSAGMAKFMNNNVAGIHVPDEMIEELKADKEKTKAGITGVEIAARIIKECKPYCQGVHIMALGWESKIPALLEQAEI